MDKDIEAIPTDPQRTFSSSFIKNNPEALAEFLRNRPVNDLSCYRRRSK